MQIKGSFNPGSSRSGDIGDRVRHRDEGNRVERAKVLSDPSMLLLWVTSL